MVGPVRSGLVWLGVVWCDLSGGVVSGRVWPRSSYHIIDLLCCVGYVLD
jgi:hypothetical protein